MLPNRLSQILKGLRPAPLVQLLQAAAYSNIRVYSQLRTAHLERAASTDPVSILYRTARYDFDPSIAKHLDLLRVNLVTLAVALFRTRPAIVEVNEPLMRPGLSFTALAVASARITAIVRRRPVTIVSYAIENRPPFKGTNLALKAATRRLIDQQLSKFVAQNLDRLVYGTNDAKTLYELEFAKSPIRARQVVIPALPAPCDCPQISDKVADSVLFLGAFHHRKGVLQLLQAWPCVKSIVPAATLTLVGKGQLVGSVLEYAERDSTIQVKIDPPRYEIHQALRKASVVVLLSQPTSLWREQVGLPIVEGLAHGCTIVTTSQTGLADWLKSHQHFVLHPCQTNEEIAQAIADAISICRSAQSVWRDLPGVDGRLQADSWLFGRPPYPV